MCFLCVVIVHTSKHASLTFYLVDAERSILSHSVHSALALWALGADREIIQAGYDLVCEYLLPRFTSPEKITAENFKQHLGDDE